MEAYFHSVEKGYGIELPTSTWLILHSSVHLPGGHTAVINTGHVEGQFQEVKVALPHFTLPIVSTVKYVEELLLSNLQVPMGFIHLMVLMVSTWMVLALPMDCHVTTSGPLSVRTVRRLQVQIHVHVITTLLFNLSPLLAATTTANRAILTNLGKVKYFQTTSYGMESSVAMKAHAALVPTLHHGSV